MRRFDEEYAVLLEGINGIEAGMASSVLEVEGIPSMKHGPDFDVGEFGSAAHDMLRGTALLVPHSALERARELLEQCGWSAVQGEAGEHATPPVVRGGFPNPAARTAVLVGLVVMAIALSNTHPLLAVGLPAVFLLAFMIARRAPRYRSGEGA